MKKLVVFLLSFWASLASAQTPHEKILELANQYTPDLCWIAGWSEKTCSEESTRAFLNAFFFRSFSAEGKDGAVVYLDPEQMSDAERGARAERACENLVAQNQTVDYARWVCPDAMSAPSTR